MLLVVVACCSVAVAVLPTLLRFVFVDGVRVVCVCCMFLLVVCLLLLLCVCC